MYRVRKDSYAVWLHPYSIIRSHFESGKFVTTNVCGSNSNKKIISMYYKQKEKTSLHLQPGCIDARDMRGLQVKKMTSVALKKASTSNRPIYIHFVCTEEDWNRTTFPPFFCTENGW